MQVIVSANELQKCCLALKGRKRIGFVPTMGYLHKGHCSLFDIARSRCDVLVASIYVNPLQFAPNEDLDSYPSDLIGDAEKCRKSGVDILFTPKVLYPPGFRSSVDVSGLTETLCGHSRPTHFRGVTTVVARLFGLTQPDIAVFGEKDYQQLAVIRQMVLDLAMPIEVIGGPLVRADDGLALSSRNRYLTAAQRRQALSISRSLLTLEPHPTGTSTAALRRKIITELEVDELDYLEFVNPRTLEPVKKLTSEIRIILAAWVGSTRLLDNITFLPQA